MGRGASYNLRFGGFAGIPGRGLSAGLLWRNNRVEDAFGSRGRKNVYNAHPE
jgi:hypothetical protein